MRIRLKVRGKWSYYDLDRVRCPVELTSGDQVLYVRLRSGNLVMGKVFSIVDNFITVEIPVPGKLPDYIKIDSLAKYKRLYRIND